MSETDLWRDRNKVFVAGLPAYVDDDALYEKFKSFGEMFQSKVVYDNKTGRSKGFGFLTFREYVNALDAVNQMNQTKWDKRVLNVRFLDPKNGKGDGAGNGATNAAVAKKPKKIFGPRPENCTTLYVGNLAYDITEEILRKVFEKCGSVRAIRFAQHIQTGEFRGFGYVQFHDGESCEKALDFDGMVVMGRPMSIDYETKDETTMKAREDLQKKLKKGICHKFQKGECTRGDDCKFAHILEHQDAEEILAGTEASTATASSDASQHDHSHHHHQDDSQANNPSAASEVTEADPDAPVCINFQKGKCKRGNKCRFLHLAAGEATVVVKSEEKMVHSHEENDSSEKAEPLQVPSTANLDSPVCINFQKGKCKRGNKCRFLHLEAKDTSSSCANSDSQQAEKSTPGPVAVTSSSSSSATTDDTTPVCLNFTTGKCKRGSACRYRHVEGGEHETSGAAGASASTAPANTRTPARVKIPEVSVCINFQAGYCARGASCRFAHTGASIPTIVTSKTEYQKRFQSVCYNWQNTRSCARGDSCPFDHDGAKSSGKPDQESMNNHAETHTKKRKADELDRRDEEDEDGAQKEVEAKVPKKNKKDKKEKKRKHECE